MVNPILGMDYELVRRLNEIERILRDLSTQPVLLHASTGHDGGTPGISTDINGLHAFDSTGTETVTISGADGSVTIRGTLNLPNGSVNNAALVSPTQTGSSGSSGSNFATSTGAAVVATGAITVPAGFTQATVMVIAGAGAVNSTGAADFIYVSASINGAAGGERAMPAAAGGYGSSTASAIRTLSGLSGGIITVAALVRTGAAWAASTSNLGNCDAIATFTR